MRRSFLDSNARLCREFRPNWVVKLDDLAQELPAVFRQTPAAGARDLGHQMTHVEPLLVDGNEDVQDAPMQSLYHAVHCASKCSSNQVTLGTMSITTRSQRCSSKL